MVTMVKGALYWVRQDAGQGQIQGNYGISAYSMCVFIKGLVCLSCREMRTDLWADPLGEAQPTPGLCKDWGPMTPFLAITGGSQQRCGLMAR